MTPTTPPPDSPRPNPTTVRWSARDQAAMIRGIQAIEDAEGARISVAAYLRRLIHANDPIRRTKRKP